MEENFQEGISVIAWAFEQQQDIVERLRDTYEAQISELQSENTQLKRKVAEYEEELIDLRNKAKILQGFKEVIVETVTNEAAVSNSRERKTSKSGKT